MTIDIQTNKTKQLKEDGWSSIARNKPQSSTNAPAYSNKKKQNVRDITSTTQNINIPKKQKLTNILKSKGRLRSYLHFSVDDVIVV
jgi:hypothetical protein